MTISTTSPYAGPYAGDGSTLTFSVTFPFRNPPDLLVVVTDGDGNETTLALDTDYTVTQNASDLTGSITLSTAVISGSSLIIARNMPYTQTTSVRNQGTFLPHIHEDTFDNLVMMIQQLGGITGGVNGLLGRFMTKSLFGDHWLGQSLRIENIADPVKDQDATTKHYVDASDAELESEIKALQIGQSSGIIGFKTKDEMTADTSSPKGTLAVVTNDPTYDNNAIYQWDGDQWVEATDRLTYALGSSLGFFAGTGLTPADGAVTRTYLEKSRDTVSVKDFGAVGDGSTDDTAAIKYAVSVARNVYFPHGTYLCSETVSIDCNPDFSITGDGPGMSVIQFSGGNGLKFNMDHFPDVCYLTIQGIGLTANQTGGSAISVDRTPSGDIETSVTIRNVTISPYASMHSSTQWWDNGIVLSGVRFVRLDDVRIWGGDHDYTAEYAKVGVTFSSTTSDAQFGLVATGVWITGFVFGLHATGWVEGIYWTGGEIWACDQAINIDRTGATQAGTFRFGQIHMNSATNVFSATNCKTISVSGCEIYQGVENSNGAQSCNLIIISNSSQAEITGNTISSAYFSSSIEVNGVFVDQSQNVTITGNNILRIPDNGVVVNGSTCECINISGNVIDGKDISTNIGVLLNGGTKSLVGMNVYGNVSTKTSLASLDDGEVYKTTYSGTAVVTIGDGTSSTYTGTISLPNGRFSSKPSWGLVQVSDPGASIYGGSYSYGASASSSTNAVFGIHTLDGSAIPSGTTVRISFLFGE